MDTAKCAKSEQHQAGEPRARRLSNLNITMERFGIVGTGMEMDLRYAEATATLWGNGDITIPFDQLPVLIAALGDIALHADEIIRDKEAEKKSDDE